MGVTPIRSGRAALTIAPPCFAGLVVLAQVGQGDAMHIELVDPRDDAWDPPLQVVVGSCPTGVAGSARSAALGR